MFQTTNASAWLDLDPIVDRVHRHTCVYATFSDMNTLLSRNNLYHDTCRKNFQKIVESCEHFIVAKAAKDNRPVALSTLLSDFNWIVNDDHLLLGMSAVFHIIDYKARFSVAGFVSSTNHQEPVRKFEGEGMSADWAPGEIQCDEAFNRGQFLENANSNGIYLRTVPPRRHSKNVMESKYRVLRVFSERPNLLEAVVKMHW